MNKTKGILWSALLILLAVSLAACGNGLQSAAVSGPADAIPPQQAAAEQPKAEAKPKNTDPVKLSVYQHGLALTDLEFEQYFVQPVSKKLPHITLELVRTGQGAQPEDLIAAGTFPDIIFTANPRFRDLKKLEVVHDLDPLIKSNQTDLNKYDPTTIEAIKLYGFQGEIIALPFARNFAALFYNKDIFDKFGVAYPQDGLDWEQTLDIARKVSRIEDGVQYRGLEAGDARQLGSPLSLPYIDPQTETARLNTDGWKRVFELVEKINHVPNNEIPSNEYGATRGNFVTKQRTAIITDWVNGISGVLEKAHLEGVGFNWDVVSVPNFTEAVGTGRNVDIHSLLVSSMSKHKEQAYDVIEYLTSEEVQLIVTQNGRLAAINSPKLEQNYAAKLESFRGKNIAGIFKSVPARLHPPTDYDQIVFTGLADATKRLVLQKDNINTILREQEEATNKLIAQEKLKTN